MKFHLRIAALLLVTSGTVLAAPTVSSVSGTLSNGQRLVISGSAFGSKASATPLVWDDFEAGSAGSQIQDQAARVGKWDTSAHSGAAKYHASNGLDGSRSALCKYWQGTGTYTCDLAKNFPNGVRKMFLSYWFYYTRVDVTTRNWKPFRLYSSDDQRQAYLQYYCSTNGAQWVLYGARSNHYFDDFISELPQPGRWHHIELLFEESDVGSSNGTFQIWVDGLDLGKNNANPVTIGSTQTAASGDSQPFTQLRFPHYWAEDGVPDCPANGGANFYVDNAYVDTSWARVELANNADYSKATVKALQVPRTWTGTSVEIDGNTAQFKSGTTAYLFVTDDSNNRNPVGFPVTIGGTQVQPQAPGNLTVQ